jgi:hypothetical protein
MIIKSKVLFKISIFGWELVLLRYPIIKPNSSNLQGIRPDGAYIKREGNFLIVCDKEGNHIGPQRSLIINDTVVGVSTVTVEYFFAGIYKEPTK